MTRSGTLAVLALIGSVAFGSAAATAQAESAPPNAASSTPSATSVAPTASGTAKLSTQVSGSGTDPQEVMPMAKTVDNHVNKPPVSGATAGSNR